MANQGIDRRAALEMIGKAAIASQFPGFNRWVFGAQHTHEESAPAEAPRHPYKPVFFNHADYETIDILTELIIPADETPGARAAGVSEFIDFMGAHGEEPLQEPMRNGLAWLNSTAAKTHGDGFRRLPEEQQTAILSMAASGKAGPEGRDFFQLIRRYTIMGYYTSRIGLKELDYPGLRLYAQSPACPHTNDPEHLHLPPAKA
jgi:hypothetical protein